jgi:DHA1 family bicyclomycin/chloramphenicol resistance-like MFS transporter
MDQQTEFPVARPALPIPRWEFIALAAADGAQRAGHRHHAAGPAADRRQSRRRERKPPAVSSSPPISSAWLAPCCLWPASDRFGRRGRCSFGLASIIAAAFAPPSRRLSRSCSRCASCRASARRRPASSPCPSCAIASAAAQMAEIMSLIFMVFMVIPVIAPSIGQIVMLFADWHVIFICMAGIACAIAIWAFVGCRRRCTRRIGGQSTSGSVGRGSASSCPTAFRSATRWRAPSSSARCSASSIRPSRSMSASTGSASGSRSSSP